VQRKEDKEREEEGLDEGGDWFTWFIGLFRMPG